MYAHALALLSLSRRLFMSGSLSALEVAGSASQETKQACLAQFYIITGVGSSVCFGKSIGKRLRLSQIDVEQNSEEPTRKQARVVCEITVERSTCHL